MLCVFMVQAVHQQGAVLTLASHAWHTATVPQAGDRVELQPSHDKVSRVAQVNSVTHHLALGEYFSSGSSIAATVLLTGSYEDVEYLLANSTMWHRI